MSRKIFDIGPDEEASVAMKKLTELRLRRLPVIENGRLLGILSREDLVRPWSYAPGEQLILTKRGNNLCHTWAHRLLLH